jgi:hypothetical protein
VLEVENLEPELITFVSRTVFDILSISYKSNCFMHLMKEAPSRFHVLPYFGTLNMVPYRIYNLCMLNFGAVL